MSNIIYTIGFTKKSAELFFTLIKGNKIEEVLDIRLNNTSQLAAFTKYPDIKYFLKEICDVDYTHDTMFAPSDSTLKKFKNNEITWEQYMEEFYQTMNSRDITRYILDKKIVSKRICLLCSESTAEQCHRGLVADIFRKIYNLDIVHL